MILSVKHNMSDLHLYDAQPARWRTRGGVGITPFTTPGVENLLICWLNEQQQVQWQEQGQLDFTIVLAGSQRLRASASVHRQETSLALRLPPLNRLRLDGLRTPDIISELLYSENGLILVIDTAGSDKLTILAAMMVYLSQHVTGYILTLEDPVEYHYTSQRCLIHQREMGVHCTSFAVGLHGALREDPGVILLGELRDAETICLTLAIAGTGHLVLVILYTRRTVQAVARLVDTSPMQEGDPMRNQLVGDLRAVLSQKLREDELGGRVALFELPVDTSTVGNLIRKGEMHQPPSIIQTG